ncbi:hypothetical protein EVG20_g6228 [Dentipellis fragilis]|uniref:Protein kinase domain-containing protein n=1 Tax=Dentipellis fragilis TaxID=205917 RepID=A0A4Y9YNC6_9AGAM|nr:hypothetical protein EVG20_g6228 [Dentipellis fragilis]
MSDTAHEKTHETGSFERSLEKGGPPAYVVHTAPEDDKFHFDPSELDRVQRKLKQRHVQMIAIAGTLGTGLFLGSGSALQGAGPLGALMAYILVGTVAYSALCSVGEMTSLAPISGTFPHFGTPALLLWTGEVLINALGSRSLGGPFVWFRGRMDSSVSISVINICCNIPATRRGSHFSPSITVPVEITSATILITFWDPDTGHTAGYIAVLCFLVCLANIFGVRWFGESEFVFSIIKRNLHDYRPHPCWPHHRPRRRPRSPAPRLPVLENPGPLAPAGLVSNINTDRFLGILSVLVQAAFSFQGMELVAIAASETENPRRNIAKAVRRVFYRIVIFYILGILITGMLVPYNDPALLNASATASESPYVIAMTRAGIKILPSIINAGILTSAFSAGNSYLFCASRILYGLALRGQAPRIFAYCTKAGLPIVAVLFSCAFTLLAFMNVSNSSATVFNWFVSLSTVGGFFTWAAINVTYIRFWHGLRAQGIDRKQFVYYSALQPGLAWWGLFWVVFFTLINGFEVFFVWDTSAFLTAYINIPIFFALWIFWRVFKRTKFWRRARYGLYDGHSDDRGDGEPRGAPEEYLGSYIQYRVLVWGAVFSFLHTAASGVVLSPGEEGPRSSEILVPETGHAYAVHILPETLASRCRWHSVDLTLAAMSSRLELHLPNESSPRSVESALDISYLNGKTLCFCDAKRLASCNSVVYQGTLRISGVPMDVNAVCKLVENDNDLAAQMENESDIYNTQLRDLQGDVVPTFYGFYKGSYECSGRTINFSCIVLDYCGTPPQEEFPALPIALRSQILDHMYAIHKAGIVHGDFREPNVLVKSTEDITSVRIIDFGLARVKKCRKRMNVQLGEYKPHTGDFGCNELWTVIDVLDLWTPYHLRCAGLTFYIFSYPDVDSLVAFLKPRCPREEESLRKEAEEVLNSWYNHYGHRIEDFGIDDPRKIDTDTFLHKQCMKAWPDDEFLTEDSDVPTSQSDLATESSPPAELD